MGTTIHSDVILNPNYILHLIVIIFIEALKTLLIVDYYILLK